MRNTDLLALRSYVMAGESQHQQSLHPDTVLVDLTHSNLKQRIAECRLSKKHTTVQQLYELLHQKTGSLFQDQRLQVYSSTDELLVGQLPPYDSPDAIHRPIAYYGLDHHGVRVHCIDQNQFSISARGALENTALVDKYVMSDADYEQRKGTIRHWATEQKQQDPSFTLQRHAVQHRQLQEAKKCHKLGQPLPNGFVWNEATQQVEATAEDFGLASVAHCTIGSRCEIQPGGRRGRIAWVGSTTATTEDEQQWVGIVLDEPVGNNDGTFPENKKRYFEAKQRHGAFCRGKNVSVGDYPERDIFDEDSEEEL